MSISVFRRLAPAGGLALEGDPDVFGDWPLWVFFLGMATLAFLQLVILNQGVHAARTVALRCIAALA